MGIESNVGGYVIPHNRYVVVILVVFSILVRNFFW
jgi:hypothetical protein